MKSRRPDTRAARDPWPLRKEAFFYTQTPPPPRSQTPPFYPSQKSLLTEEGTGAGRGFCAGLRIRPGKPARCMKRSGRPAFSPLTWCI